MKLVKQAVAFILLATLILTMSIPAFAATIDLDWEALIGGFRYTTQWNYTTGYAGAVQSILYGYNDKTYDYIASYGGIDGIFGAMTHKAVEEFQGKESLGVDGKVGEKTWAKMGSLMHAESTGLFDIDLFLHGRRVLTAINDNTICSFMYCNEYDSPGSVFHMVYV